MRTRPLSLSAAIAALLIAGFALPESADARGGSRRNYADEMRQDDLRKEREEERDRRRQEQIEHHEETQRRWQEHQAQRQDRYLNHRERQLDKVLDYGDGLERQRAPGPAPAKPAPKGTCIYGEGDKILYQPKGVVCSK